MRTGGEKDLLPRNAKTLAVNVVWKFKTMSLVKLRGTAKVHVISATKAKFLEYFTQINHNIAIDYRCLCF